MEKKQTKTQEATLAKGVKICREIVKKPKPNHWKTKLSSAFIQKAINDGRE